MRPPHPCTRCGTPTRNPTPRCANCEQQHQRDRNQAPHRQAYRDPQYRKARATIRQTATHCGLCGEPFTDTRRSTADHTIPLAQGGTNDPSNLGPACGPCNSAKGARTTQP